MRTFTAIIERCAETGLFVGYVPGLPGAHSQEETLVELSRNMRDVVEMLLEDGEPTLEIEFVGPRSQSLEDSSGRSLDRGTSRVPPSVDAIW